MKKLFIIALLILLPVFAHAAVLYPVGSSVRASWNDSQVDIESYEVILIRDGTGVVYGPYHTTLKSIEIPRPKAGIYEMRVRGYRNGMYSEWCSSLGDDAILKTGVLGKWKAFFKLLGPTGPIIIY